MSKVELTDEEANRRYTWLTSQAGTQLQDLTGGSTLAPVFSRLSVEQLELIADYASSLAEHHQDAGEVEDPSITPFDQLPEEAQKAVKEDEKRAKAAGGEPVKSQEQRQAEGQSQVESNPHPLEDATGARPGQGQQKAPAGKDGK